MQKKSSQLAFSPSSHFFWCSSTPDLPGLLQIKSQVGSRKGQGLSFTNLTKYLLWLSSQFRLEPKALHYLQPLTLSWFFARTNSVYDKQHYKIIASAVLSSEKSVGVRWENVLGKSSNDFPKQENSSIPKCVLIEQQPFKWERLRQELRPMRLISKSALAKRASIPCSEVLSWSKKVWKWIIWDQPILK